jgi:hypothetical protein
MASFFVEVELTKRRKNIFINKKYRYKIFNVSFYAVLSQGGCAGSSHYNLAKTMEAAQLLMAQMRTSKK